MLIHSNATVNIERMELTDWVSALVEVKTGYGVYINSRQEAIIQSTDSQGAYKEFLMMTDGIFIVNVWDKIVWGARTFVVQWGEKFSDLTGEHGQYILMETFNGS